MHETILTTHAPEDAPPGYCRAVAVVELSQVQWAINRRAVDLVESGTA